MILIGIMNRPERRAEWRECVTGSAERKSAACSVKGKALMMGVTDAFEERISPRQDLSFRKTESVFSAQGLPFGREQMGELGLLRDGAFTGLGLLLSDQCPFTLRAAVFRDRDQMEWQDRRGFSGPLFGQLEGCFEFLQLQNPLSASFEGLAPQGQQALS